jgi:ATP-dependent protease ClpP protease subunit
MNWIFALSTERDSVTITIGDVIAPHTQSSLRAVLDALKGKRTKRIDLQINSVGGSVTEAEAIRSAIRASGARVHATILGIAASAATIILDAADEVSIGRGAFVMIHQAAGSMGRGTADDHRRAIRTLTQVDENLLSMYVAASARRGKNKTAEDFRAAMLEETYFNARDAVAWGLADRIVDDAVAIAAHADLSMLSRPLPVDTIGDTLAKIEALKEGRLMPMSGETDDAFIARVVSTPLAELDTRTLVDRICDALEGRTVGDAFEDRPFRISITGGA